jgi:flagellar protein FlbD
MILLTRLNGTEFVLNAEMIRYVERCPDTLISLITGETIMVAESMEEVVQRSIAYQQAKHYLPPIGNVSQQCRVPRKAA